MASMGEMRNAYIILIGYCEGKRPAGRPWRKEKVGIKWRSKKGNLRWTGLLWFGKRGPCGSRVNAVIHFQVSRKADSFLRMDFRFLRRIPIQGSFFFQVGFLTTVLVIKLCSFETWS
jgi:hypothetical protein